MKLSIITTVYQAEKDLPRLFDSMMSNKSQEVEFFLIDNGSSDGSAGICREYAEKDSRFHIHTLKENIGYIRARNLGLDIVDADYVGFCDSDDFVEAGAYDAAIEKIKESDCDLLIGGWNTISGDSMLTTLPPFECRTYSGKEDIETIMPQFFGSYEGRPMLRGFMWKQFFRLSIFRDYGIRFRESLKPYEDMLLNAQYIKHCSRVMVTDTVIYNYIVNPKSITAKIVNNYSVREESARISGLISILRQEAPDDRCETATANLGLTLVIIMMSISSRLKRPATTISAEIRKSLAPECIDFISKQSSPQTTQYKILRWCLRRNQIRSLLLLFKLRNR